MTAQRPLSIHQWRLASLTPRAARYDPRERDGHPSAICHRRRVSFESSQTLPHLHALYTHLEYQLIPRRAHHVREHRYLILSCKTRTQVEDNQSRLVLLDGRHYNMQIIYMFSIYSTNPRYVGDDESNVP